MLDDIRGTPKVHPLDREMLPEDPLHLQAFEIPGDTELMFRVVIEEFTGEAPERIERLLRARMALVGAVTESDDPAATVAQVVGGLLLCLARQRGQRRVRRRGHRLPERQRQRVAAVAERVWLAHCPRSILPEEEPVLMKMTSLQSHSSFENVDAFYAKISGVKNQLDVK